MMSASVMDLDAVAWLVLFLFIGREALLDIVICTSFTTEIMWMADKMNYPIFLAVYVPSRILAFILSM